MRACLVSFLLLTVCASASAQKNQAAGLAAKDTAIARLFDKPASIKWLGYYKGRLDDASGVSIGLGYDGRNCRGYMTYIESKVRLRLDGQLDTTGFRLVELGQRGDTTGYLRGILQNKRMIGEWTNFNNTLGSRLEATETASGGTAGVAHCSENKWVNRYITRWNESRVDFILSRANNGALYGYLWVEADKKTYTLRGNLFDGPNFLLEAMLPNGRTAGRLEGSVKNPQAVECTWTGGGEKRTYKFIQKENIPVGCFEYADYTSSYDAFYPRVRCNDCNTWLDKQVTDWVNRCKAGISAKKNFQIPVNRNALRASSWTEIACWTDNIFSGYMTFTDSWSEQPQGIAFNFQMVTGKEIKLEDLFQKSFDARKWLDEYARKESPKLAKYAEDPKFREWLQKNGFPMFAVRRDGLEISTLFHPLYGRQFLLVPYDALRSYFKKDNPIAEFLKG